MFLKYFENQKWEIEVFEKNFWTSVTKYNYFAIFHISERWSPKSVKSKVTVLISLNDMNIYSLNAHQCQKFVFLSYCKSS